jgi:hypothetical protein
LPISLARRARKTADHGDQDCHPGRRRDEVLDREPEHLREIAHRRLAAVTLPVGVAGEAHGSVEGRVGTHRGKALRVQRQHALQPLQQVHHDEADEIEQQQCERVALPVRFDRRLDGGEAIDAALDRFEHRRQEGTLAVVHLGHERAERLDQRHQHGDEQQDLHQAPARSFEFLRQQQRYEQVNPEGNRQHQTDPAHDTHLRGSSHSASLKSSHVTTTNAAVAIKTFPSTTISKRVMPLRYCRRPPCERAVSFW